MEISRSRVVVRLGVAVVALIDAYTVGSPLGNWLFDADTDGCRLLQRLFQRLFQRLLQRLLKRRFGRGLGLRDLWRLLLHRRLLRLRNSRSVRDGLLQRIHGKVCGFCQGIFFVVAPCSNHLSQRLRGKETLV